MKNLTTEELHEKAKKLTALWYRCLVDHHKDRDCHFYITSEFSYSGIQEWSVIHNGYIAEFEVKHIPSYRECLIELCNNLYLQIKREAESGLDPEVELGFFEKRSIGDEYWNTILRELSETV